MRIQTLVLKNFRSHQGTLLELEEGRRPPIVPQGVKFLSLADEVKRDQVLAPTVP
jgi:hypothetical protein